MLELDLALPVWQRMLLLEADINWGKVLTLNGELPSYMSSVDSESTSAPAEDKRGLSLESPQGDHEYVAPVRQRHRPRSGAPGYGWVTTAHR